MRMIGIALAVLLTMMGGVALAAAPTCEKRSTAVSKDKSSEKKGAQVDGDEAVKVMAEEFGVIVGPVTEDIKKELNLRSAEGVAVFEVIGDSLAEKSGIKVHAVIAEINKKPVRNLADFGRLLCESLDQGNFTVGTWEPTSPDNQGSGQQMNFHFVPKLTD